MTTPQQFYERALAAADADGRLPMLQLRGSCLWLWEEMLPTLPPDVVAGVVETAVAALADLGEVRV